MTLVPEKLRALARRFNRRDPGICKDLKSWQASQCDGAASIDILARSRGVRRELPKTIEPVVAPEFLAHQEFKTYERFVRRVRNARIVGESGFVVLPDGRFAIDYVTHHEPFILESPVYFQRFSTARRRRKHWQGSYFSILGRFCRTHYHWMHDVLSQLHQVLDYLPPEVRIVVPAPLTGLQRRTLEVLGVPEARLAFHAPDFDVTVDELYFIPPPAITSFDDPTAMNWLREKLCVGMPLNPPGGGPHRIYVSRGRAGCRRIANEEVLMRCLVALGFQSLHCEDMDFDEQAAAFRQAEVVVAPHGAGLANLLFCRPGTKVLEIFPASLLRTCYWSLAEALGLDYAYVFGEARENGSQEADIQIAPERIQAGLRLLGL